MFGDKKIRKEISRRIKPRFTFDEFCAANGIVIESVVEQGNTKVVRKARRVFGITLPVLCCCIIIVAVCLVCFLPKPSFPPLNEFKFHGADDVKEEFIDSKELLDANIPLLLDFDKVEQFGSVAKVVPKDEETLCLGYTINDILYGFFKNEQLFAFSITLKIRCYNGYEFSDQSQFINLTYEYDDNCRYSVFDHSSSAYIAITQGDYEYFIKVKEYAGITPITKENIEYLIADIYN